ncbi:VOC family protein [Novosphingobium malaysiense]|uniref:VOC domain-containing protein n=1 Tax=Novosphingobium malaysiense TaxID=1348853 RepID=A0A0B1ZKI4_9SPHN|nr:VOC family protein [Novosphingobium malaysiense]KHK89805.1 hypothetical protein LK12_17935 [Novosphingobium malaysiense]
MIVQGLDHVNIRTPDLEATRRFFTQVLEMRHGPPPGMDDEGMGVWLYDGEDRAVVHLGRPETPYPSDETFPFEGKAGSARLHHVALRCRDFPGVRDRLRDAGYRYSENRVEAIRLRQLFVEEWNGILLELNFFED